MRVNDENVQKSPTKSSTKKSDSLNMWEELSE